MNSIVKNEILEKGRENYSYRVQLLKEKLLYEDIEVLLKREVRRLKE